jgi:hypothetical protein
MEQNEDVKFKLLVDEYAKEVEKQIEQTKRFGEILDKLNKTLDKYNSK